MVSFTGGFRVCSLSDDSNCYLSFSLLFVFFGFLAFSPSRLCTPLFLGSISPLVRKLPRYGTSLDFVVVSELDGFCSGIA